MVGIRKTALRWTLPLGISAFFRRRARHVATFARDENGWEISN